MIEKRHLIALEGIIYSAGCWADMYQRPQTTEQRRMRRLWLKRVRDLKELHSILTAAPQAQGVSDVS